MAEEDAAIPAAKGAGSIFTKKIGPLPAGVWLIVAGLIYYYVKKRGETGGSAGTQTDPAGNTGAINPATGYVYGTSEDQSALGGINTGGISSSNTDTSTTGGQYKDNDSWASAAINYLVGIGIDPTAANSAVQQFLASQVLTTNQQADVNLAIQRIGAPPSPPQPGSSPGPIVTPPSPGTTYATNPPSGLTVSSVATTSVVLKWNAATNAKSYSVTWGTTSAATGGSATVPSTNTTTLVGNLKPNTLYYFRVQAQPAKSGDPYASISKTTAKATGAVAGSETAISTGSAVH